MYNVFFFFAGFSSTLTNGYTIDSLKKKTLFFSLIVCDTFKCLRLFLKVITRYILLACFYVMFKTVCHIDLSNITVYNIDEVQQIKTMVISSHCTHCVGCIIFHNDLFIIYNIITIANVLKISTSARFPIPIFR